MPITINDTTDYRIGFAQPILSAFTFVAEGTYVDPPNRVGSMNPTFSGFTVVFDGDYANSTAPIDGSVASVVSGFTVNLEGGFGFNDQPPVIVSTPSPSFVQTGSEQTYDMSQHWTDDGLTIVTSELVPAVSASDGLSYDGSAHILTYDGVAAVSSNTHVLQVTDGS